MPRKVLALSLLAAGLCAAGALGAVTATPSSVSAFPTQTTQAVALSLTFPPSVNGGTGTFTAAGLPPGTTTVPNPVSYTTAAGGTSASTSFQFSVGAATTPGTYPVTLRDNTNGAGAATVTLVVQTPGYTASAAPNPVTLTIGGAAQQVTVSTKTDPGFNGGSITYSFSGLPNFIVNNGPQTTTGTTNYGPVSFTFSLGPGAVAGTYPGTLTGMLPTGAPQSFPFTVVVQQPDIAASFTQPAISVCAGGTANDTVQLTPLNGYSGSPSLTFTSPAGITISPLASPKLPPAQTVPFTITTSANATSGIATLNISDPAVGINKSIQLQITVTQPDFTASVAPASIALTAGGSAQNVTASIVQNSCFATSVTVTASTPVNGITIAPNPATIAPPGFAPASMAIRAAATTPAGTYVVTFTFTGGGVTRTATVQVVVNAAPDFILNVNPASLSIAAGSSSTTNVTFTPVNGFTGSVSVTIPATNGLTFTPSTFTLAAGAAQTVTVAVAAGVAPGTIPVVFSATSPTITGTRTATLQVTVGSTPTFILTLTPDTLSLAPGGTATVAAGVTAVNGFSGTVTVTAPSSTGVTFTPATFTLTPGATQNIAMSVDPTAASGLRSLLFQATSPGVTGQGATLSLTITARSDFTLTVAPSSVSIRPGSSATVVVSASGGYTGPITVGVTPPAGLQITPSTFTLNAGGSQQVTVQPSGVGSATLLEVVFSGTIPGSATPHTATLVVNLLPPGPGLTSATPPSLVIGTQSTIVRVAGDFLQTGAQFRSSDPSLIIKSANVLTPQLADVRISVRADASPGPRNLTVTNPDGSTSAPLAILLYPSTSIAAPLDVLAAAIVYPPQGTMLAPDDAVYARGLLATSGTGTITGTWQFDGAPFDRFVVNAAGGMPVEVRSNVPLPVAFNGSHTVTIAIESPRKFVAPTIEVISSADRASRLTLLAPRDGAVIGGPEQLFRWSLVPNCSGYDVEVAPADANAPIARFHVANAEWKPSADDVASIGPGIHRWRVRPRCSGETALEPTAWQRVMILPAHVDITLQPSTTNAKGARVLHWSSGVTGLLYRVEFVSPSGDVIFSALTGATEYAIPKTLPAGTTFRVSALAPDGKVLGTSPSSPPLSRRDARDPYRLVQETIVDIQKVEPADGATVTGTQPHIAAEWKGAVTADQVMFLVDNVDVTQVAKITATSVAYDSLIALAPGEHSAAVAVAGNIRRWTFIVPGAAGAGAPAAAQPRGDWVVAPVGSITLVRDANRDARVQLSGLTDFNGASYANKTTGDVSLHHDLDNNKTKQESRNWVTDIGAHQDAVSAAESARVGYAPPMFLDQAQLMSAGMPRGGVEGKLGSRFGSVAYYETFESTPAGLVTGLFGPAQKIKAAAYQSPLDPKYDFRIIGLHVDEGPGATSEGGTGRTIGFFGRYTLGTSVNAIAEIAHGEFSPAAGSLDTHRKGNAARVGITGMRGTLNYAVNLQRTAADFVNPANRAFTPAGVPDRFGGDLTIGKLFGTTSISAQLRHLQDGTTAGLMVPRTRQNGGMLTFLRPLGAQVSLSLTGNFTKDSGEAKPEAGLPHADRDQAGGTATLSEIARGLFFSETLSRQTLRDHVNDLADTTTTLASFTAGGQLSKWFYISAMLSGTRLESNPTAGTTNQYLGALQPIFSIPQWYVTLQPRATYSTSKNDLFAATTTEQYAALATFSPQWFNQIFSLQLSSDWTRSKSGLVGVPSPFVRRLVASFNLRWRDGYGPAFVQGALIPMAQPAGGMNPAMSMPGGAMAAAPH